MSENEWWACDDPRLLIAWLTGGIPDGVMVSASDPIMGACPLKVSETAWRQVCRAVAAYAGLGDDWFGPDEPLDPLIVLIRFLAAKSGRPDEVEAYPLVCDFIRDVAGNPYHRYSPNEFRREYIMAIHSLPGGGAVHAFAFAVNDTARQIAWAIDAEERFGDLPVLADALEECGCTDQRVPEHLRSPGPHIKGCWALSLMLDR